MSISSVSTKMAWVADLPLDSAKNPWTRNKGLELFRDFRTTARLIGSLSLFSKPGRVSICQAPHTPFFLQRRAEMHTKGACNLCKVATPSKVERETGHCCESASLRVCDIVGASSVSTGGP